MSPSSLQSLTLLLLLISSATMALPTSTRDTRDTEEREEALLEKATSPDILLESATSNASIISEQTMNTDESPEAITAASTVDMSNNTSTMRTTTPLDKDKKPLVALDKLLRKYDRRSTPTNDQAVATRVSCQLFVASLSSINTENMDYVTDTYLRQKWSDPRLSDPDIDSSLDLADPNLVKAIWKPEVYFPNAKEADFQFVTVPNVLIRIHPGGEILYILRLRLKFSCMMELSRYPLDTQVCAMQISSFSKTTKELVLSWDRSDGRERAVTVAPDLKMPQFEMQRIHVSKCHEQNHMGNYSCLVAAFHLHRSIGFHLIQSYLPSILIVSISWVSFWMDVDCVPARVTLGVITLLTVSSQVSGTSVPQTSYVKAIDVWMGVCTAFVFAALVEFTCVNYLWRKAPDANANNGAVNDCFGRNADILGDDNQHFHLEEMNGAGRCGRRVELAEPESSPMANMAVNTEKIRETRDSEKMWSPSNNLNRNQSFGTRHQRRFRNRATRIDEICRFLFPIGFALFNALYWTYYRNQDPIEEDEL